MIDIRKLKELVRLMVANELTELDLRDSEEQVTLRRGSPPAAASPLVPAAALAGDGAASLAAALAAPAAPAPVDDEEGMARIASPMVGTFFAAPNPDAPPFVTVGSPVEAETVVCVMEAMKIFNEIKAEVSGTIHRAVVKNGEAVEFGQTLFLVKPN